MRISDRLLAHLAHHKQELVVISEVCYFLLEIVNRAVKIAGAIDKHVQSLIAASLVVKNHNDQVAVYFLSLSGDVFKHLLSSPQGFERTVSFFVLKFGDSFIVDVGQHFLHIIFVLIPFVF
jgi:hypothetical protein